MLGALTSTEVDRPALLRRHYSFQQGCFVSEHCETAGGILAHSHVTPIPMWNHSAWLDQDAADFPAFLRRSVAWQTDRNRRPVVYLPEPTAEQESDLREHGFEKFDEEAWMVCELPDAAHVPAPEARAVNNEKVFQDFIGTFSTAFQIKEDGYRTVLKSGNNSDVQSHHFVLYDDAGVPVSVGTLVYAHGTGCIYNVGTPPQKRNKGYGRRLFEHIAAAARESGCERLFLQVENKSSAMRLYEKCGFRTEFVRIGYRLADWKPARIGRTKLANLLGYRSSETAAPQFVRETRALPSGIPDQLRKSALETNRNLCAGAIALLLHRYTGDETVDFTFSDPSHPSPQRVSVAVDRSQSISQWLENLVFRTPASDSAAGEILLSLHGRSTNHLEQPACPLEIRLLAETGTIEIIYRSDLFTKDSIRRLAAHLGVILDFIISHSAAKLSELEMLSAGEKHQLLVEWNQPAFEAAAETIAHLFEMRVERTPDATGLMFAGVNAAQASEQLTYRQLNRKANRLAHRLQELGVRSEVFVGVCMDRSLDMVVSLLAILKAGGACVPLDPSYPSERLRFMLQDANAPVILTQKHLLTSIEGVSHARFICIDEPAPDAKSDHERNPTLRATPESAAYMIYTSGSTGTPKGVVISNYAIANHCLDCARVYGLSSKDRVLQFSSFNFDAAFEQILPALISGACLVVRGNEVWNTHQFAQKLHDCQLTVIDIPTAYWHQLTCELSASPEAVPSNSLRLAIVGGEALSPEKVDLWKRTPLGNVRLINAYGPTETTITATSYEFSALPCGDSNLSIVPIGRPRGDRKAYVLDRFGNPTPIGIPGELHVGGTLLARGYHKRSELTNTRFIPNPFSDEPDARLYRTGDLVRYLDDGNLEFLGRIDDQIKIRGFRIELGEIEACLCKHPAVREAIVLARPDNNNELRLAAYILPDTSEVIVKDVKGFIRSRLPDYMIPAHFVLLEKWPLMPNGKVDRRALPEPSEGTAEIPVKGPEDPLELQLQLLFERVLKHAPIGVDVSFFELGGDSLQALELLVEIEKATRKQLPLGTLYQSSTVQALAREVRTRSTCAGWSSLVPLQVSGKRPPLYLLHTTPGDVLGYGNLIYHLDSDQPCYGFQSLGLKAPELCHQTVLEMARYYVERLRELQPRGPYYLGGWCYGGIVAVEMARILKQQGEHIGLLALLETVAVPARPSNLRYYLHRLACFLKMSPQNWITYFRGKARYTRESRIANKLRFRPAQAAMHEGERDKRLIQLEHVYNTNLAALKGYRSEYYEGKVTLFNAAERDPALIPDPFYGWVGLARDIEIHEVPGDHDTMLAEPHVSALAQRLNDCLIRAQRSQTGSIA